MEVVLLTYANSYSSPLPNLKEEAINVYGLFCRKARDRNLFPIYEPFTSISQINEIMKLNEGHISVFSYSGHADNNAILLEDEIANPIGIGLHLMSSIESGALKLVVLNGCSTKGQVENLLKIGVPVVIATHAKINDLSACEFAKAFFKSLTELEKTILESFNDGLEMAQLALNEIDLRNKQIRHLDFLENYDKEKPLWEIFALNDQYAKRKIIPPLNRKLFNFRGNEKIFKTIYTSFYNAKNQQVMKLWEKEKQEVVQQHEKENILYNSIPRPIGFQLEKLLRFDTHVLINKNFNKWRLIQLGQLFQSMN